MKKSKCLKFERIVDSDFSFFGSVFLGTFIGAFLFLMIATIPGGIVDKFAPEFIGLIVGVVLYFSLREVYYIEVK